jgi:ATP-dependent Lhr-like helicase
MDLPGLEALLAAIARDEVKLHFRDTTEPSPLCHEILNSRPYTFLDDAPLEERRTRAVQLRRGLPQSARELSALDPEAIARVRDEVRSAPRDASELHDVLLARVLLRPSSAEQVLFDELLQSARAFVLVTRAGPFWCAREQRREAELLFPGATCEPDLPLPAALLAEPAPSVEAAVERVVRGYLDCAGPTTLDELVLGTGLDTDVLAAALARVEMQGFALRGCFEIGHAERAEQYCARRLLGRIHAYTQKRLRREIEPVSAQDFMRFLLRHQGVEPGHQRHGTQGVLSVVEQLQGFELAAAAWEADVLAARVEAYRPAWLDGLCLSGQIAWGRGSLPAARAEEGRAALLSRATPVTLAMRGDFPWLLRAARQAAATAALPEETARVLACLESSGALFLPQLAQSSGLREEQVRDALWDGVARGLVTADGWSALRNLIAPRTAAERAWGSAERRAGLRQGSRSVVQSDGRWSLLAAGIDLAEPLDRDALAEALAEQLVARWGVVFRDVLAFESFALPWREIVWALRRLEARGKLRGGRFVNGFVGEQYALPEAVEMLRAVRREPRRGSVVRLSACDPLNLTGAILHGARVPALRTQFVSYRDGALAEAEALPVAAL